MHPKRVRMGDDPTQERADETDGNLAKTAVRGAAVTVTAQGSKIALQVLSVVVLARLIGPSDYGLIAMVTAVIGFADIFRDFGLSSAAIQAPRLSRDEQVNLFWANTALGAVLALLVVAGSPLIAAFYGQPDLTIIAIALSVNFLLNGMATQYRADLNRRMRFRQLAIADVAGPAVGLVVAIGMAVNGAGFWSLVVQQITQVGVMLILVAVGAHWLPGLYRRGTSIRRFLAFGLKLVGSQVIGYIGSNADTVALGLTVSPHQLGLYNRAYQLVMTPVGQVRGPLNTVAIPVLSRLQHDHDRFDSFVQRGQVALGYTLVVGLAAVAGVAAPLVTVALGDDWVGAAPVVALLAIGAAFQTLAYVGYWVYVARGLVSHLLPYTMLATGIRLACVAVGAGFGVIGVAVAMATVPFVSWPLSFWWLSRRASIPVRALWIGGLRVMSFALLVGAAAIGAVMVSAQWGAWVSLLAGILAAAVCYAVLVAAVPPYRRDVNGVVLLLREHLRR